MKTPNSLSLSSNNNIPSKILLVVHSRGRTCKKIMRNIFKESYFETLCFFKPNASFENVIHSAKQLTVNYNMNDFVVILAGSNDGLNNNHISAALLEILKHEMSHTNLVVFLTPFKKRNVTINSKILQDNMIIYSVLGKSAIINTSSILNQLNFAGTGLHIHVKGKYKLLYYLKHQHIASIWSKSVKRYFVKTKKTKSSLNTKKNFNFYLMYLNSQSIRNKRDLFDAFLINNNCKILCLSEYWFTELEIKELKIGNFNASSYSCRLNGGTFHRHYGFTTVMHVQFKTFKLLSKSFNLIIVSFNQCVFIDQRPVTLISLKKSKQYLYEDKFFENACMWGFQR